jgi:hypothetical protein
MQPNGRLLMMKSLTGININLERGASSQNFLRHTSATTLQMNTKPSFSDGTASRKKVRCAIRGDTMVPSVEYDYENPSAQTPSHTCVRLLVALTAANSAVMESWDVPGAYPQAAADPNYRQTMIQPPRSDGTYEAPGSNFVPSKRRCSEPTMRDSYGHDIVTLSLIAGAGLQSRANQQPSSSIIARNGLL